MQRVKKSIRPIEGRRPVIAKGKYEYWLTDDGLLFIEGWAREGLTDEQIASKMGIARATLYSWQKLYPDILDALKKGKAPVDLQVENALLRRATGTTVTETTEEIYTDGVDEDGKPIVKSRHVRKVTRELPPDTAAAFIWLKNRRPDRWRDRRENDSKASDERPIIIDTRPVKGDSDAERH